MAQLAAQLEDLHSLDLPYAADFDDRLLIQLLLCIAAGERSLVVRVGAEGEALSAHERREWVQRVGAEIAWLCHTFFSLKPHQVSCTSKHSASAFLRSIFLPLPGSTTMNERRGSWLASRKDTSPAKTSFDTVRRSENKIQRRSASAPLGVTVPPVGGDDNVEVRVRSPLHQTVAATLPGRASPNSKRPEPILTDRRVARDPLPYDASVELEELAADESSAGEDLYPSKPMSPTRLNLERRKSTQPGPAADQPSTPRRARRSTQSGYDFVGSKVVEAGMTGLGLGGVQARPGMEAGGRGSGRRVASPPRSPSFRPGDSPRSPLTMFAASNPPQPPSARRPSTASIQSTLGVSLAAAVPRPPSPTLPRLLRSPPSGASPTSPSFAPSFMSRRRSSALPMQPSSAAPHELPQVLILEHLERTRPSVQKRLLDLLRERRFTIEGRRNRTGQPQSPAADDTASVRTRRTEMTLASAMAAGMEGVEGSWALPSGFICVAIVCESDQEHDGAWGGVSRHLFDRFSLSHTIPAKSFDPPYAFDAPALHPLSAPSAPRVSPVTVPRDYDLAPALQTYLSDLVSTLRHHPQLEGRMLTARTSIELALYTRIWVALSRGEGSMLLPRDVVAVVMSVVGHRLAMRAPRDEKSVFWGSDIQILRAQRSGGVAEIVREVVGKV